MSNINYEQIKKNVSINNYQSSPFELFQDVETKSNFDGNIKHIQTETGLSTTYFSKKNIDFLQNEIIRIIYQKSNNKYKIGRQSDTQLQIIMRSTYLSYSKNLSGYLEEQLNQLNDMVIKECVIRIMPEIKQYLGYREDVSKSRDFMPLPQYLSESGKDTFPLMN